MQSRPYHVRATRCLHHRYGPRVRAHVAAARSNVPPEPGNGGTLILIASAPSASGPCGQTTLNWIAPPPTDAIMTPISGHRSATRRWPATKQQAPPEAPAVRTNRRVVSHILT